MVHGRLPLSFYALSVICSLIANKSCNFYDTSQVDKICKVASKPLVVTYTGLIQTCLTNGNIHDAASIFNHMQKYCSPNTVTCNVMLKAYLGCGMFDEAVELFRKMTRSRQKGSKIKSEISPDVYTFNTMLEACIKEERWDDFKCAYEQMLQHGHPFNTKRHLWMVLQASGARKVSLSLSPSVCWSTLFFSLALKIS